LNSDVIRFNLCFAFFAHQRFQIYSYNDGREEDHQPDRPAVVGVAVLVARVGAEDQAREKADVEADKGRDRVEMLSEKRGDDRDRGGDVEHIAAEQPVVEIAVLARGRCAEQPREDGIVAVAPDESAYEVKEKIPRRDAKCKDDVLL